MPLTPAGTRPIDPILTQLASLAVPSDAGLVADALSQVVDAESATGTVINETGRPFMGAPGKQLLRAAGAVYQELHDADPGRVVYDTVERAAMGSVDMSMLERSQVGDLEQRKMALCRRVLLLASELDTFTSLDGAAIPTSTLAALPGGSGIQFGAAGAREISDILRARLLARNATNGVWPDVLLMGVEAAVALTTARQIQQQFVGAVPTGQSGLALTFDELKVLLMARTGAREVLIGDARIETAVPDAPSAQVEIWPDTFWWLYSRQSDVPDAAILGGLMTSGPVTYRKIYSSLRGAPGMRMGVDRILPRNPPVVQVACWHTRAEVVINAAFGREVTDCVP